MNLLEFQDFSAYYKLKKGYAVALDHISLNVEQGELLVLVGPSGCGKTTLLKCILGLCSYTDGTLLFEGKPLTRRRKRDGTIAYVTQEYSLYPQMTVYENIAFPLRMAHVPQRETEVWVQEMAGLVGMKQLLTRKPSQLSGGQQQRVAIARALVKRPRLMLFDEPFSNLEPGLRLELRELLKKIHAERRPTILFVTHDIPEALALAQRGVIINQGMVAQVGTPQELEPYLQSDFTKEHLE